jgi:hypothetical protein
MKTLLAAALLLAAAAPAAAPGLEARAELEPVHANAAAERTRFNGVPAVRLRDTAGLAAGHRLLLLPVESFRNGVIRGRFSGRPTPGGSATARGFVGIAFRVQPGGERYEAFYLRPTNGRSEDQLRRNRSVQYVSEPDFPWERLRKENPGVYESYADMDAGLWIDFRIEVEGPKARFYLNGAAQPALIVNDLKLGADAAGGVALWVGPEADGHFADIKVERR